MINCTASLGVYLECFVVFCSGHVMERHLCDPCHCILCPCNLGACNLIFVLLHCHWSNRIAPVTIVETYLWNRTATNHNKTHHYGDVTMSAMASQITSLAIIYWTVFSGPDQTKHQSSVPLAFVRGIHRWPVNSPHKGPVTRKMFPFDDVIMFKCKPCA